MPFIYIVAASFATEIELTERKFFLFPRDPSLAAYEYIFSSHTCFAASAIRCSLQSSVHSPNLAFTLSMAYSLSRKDLNGRTFFMNLVIFSMLFSGGMIPGYLVVKDSACSILMQPLFCPGRSVLLT